ncbi:MAG: tetratricopeptide repeat protein, partial [Halanaerobiales bacterium]|nr:tetratricopeptide repeat protein [Halanaerobiales bacterium]
YEYLIPGTQLLQTILLNTIEDLYNVHKYSELLEAIDEAIGLIKDKKTKLDLNHKKGASLVHLGNFSAAIQIFESFIEEDCIKTQIKGLGNLAWVYILLHQNDTSLEYLIQAENYCQKALTLTESYNTNLYTKVLINLGNIYWHKRNYEKALNIFLKASSLLSDNPAILNNIAATYVSLRDSTLAKKYLKKAEEIAEKEKNYYEVAQSIFIHARITEEIVEDFIKAKDFYLVAFDNFIETNSFSDACKIMKRTLQLDQKINNEYISLLSTRFSSHFGKNHS